MVRSDIITLLGNQNPDLPASEIHAIISVFFETITSRLTDGGSVHLRGFGSFGTRRYNARLGRNPRTGEPVEVPAMRAPYFSPGKDLRECVAASVLAPEPVP